MKSCKENSIFILLLLVILLVISGCNNSDSTKTEETQKIIPLIVGTWQQTAIGKEEVSGVVVKVTFSEHTMTMDAPGCMIIGDYTTADGVLTYTVTSTQGERCVKNQTIGQSDSVHYRVTESELILTPLLAKKENQLVYKRINADQHE